MRIAASERWRRIAPNTNSLAGRGRSLAGGSSTQREEIHQEQAHAQHAAEECEHTDTRQAAKIQRESEACVWEYSVCGKTRRQALTSLHERTTVDTNNKVAKRMVLENICGVARTRVHTSAKAELVVDWRYGQIECPHSPSQLLMLRLSLGGLEKSNAADCV